MDITEILSCGASIRLEIAPSDLLEFGRSLLKSAQEEIRKELEAAKGKEDETYLGTQEVCKLCEVCEGTLIAWERRGYLLPARIGRKKKYALSDIKKMMRNRRLGKAVSWEGQEGQQP